MFHRCCLPMRYSALFFLFFHFTLTRPESLSSGGCTSPNSTVVSAGDVWSDEQWWYKCRGRVLVPEGCTVNGHQYNPDDTFVGYKRDFHGKCRLVNGKYLTIELLGCVDFNGNKFDPGDVFQIDPDFWANCTSTERIIDAAGIGNVTVKVIGREMVGCNDGTYDIVHNNTNLVRIIAVSPLFSGIGLVCRLGALHSQLEPVVCLVANNTADQTFVVLRSGCYVHLHNYIYYCTIDQDAQNGSKLYSWQFGWNYSDSQILSDLKSKSFQDCQNQQQQNLTVPNSPTTHPRLKRSNAYETKDFNDDSIFAFSDRTRLTRSANWDEASSKVIAVNIYD